MINTFHITNFKSLEDFSLPPGQRGEIGGFTCIIGPNGAGKSTILQAFDFVAQLPSGNISTWLQTRGWEKNELTNRADSKKKLINFSLVVTVPSGTLYWSGVFNTNQLRCTKEEVLYERNEELYEGCVDTILSLEDGELQIADENAQLQFRGKNLRFEGSAMSLIDSKREHVALRELATDLKNLKSLELLAPHLLRKRWRKSEDVGERGERLSAFLDTLSASQRAQLVADVQQLYSSFHGFEVQTKQGGWKNLRVQEGASQEIIDAKHLNDGLLRILAILSQAHSSHSFLLFDEIENGLNPEVIEQVMAFLLQMEQQVFITTHSPLILNFIPDAVALENVILIYKDGRGITRSIRFFDLPHMRERLEFLGPGEVLIDTDLMALIEQQIRSEASPEQLKTT